MRWTDVAAEPAARAYGAWLRGREGAVAAGDLAAIVARVPTALVEERPVVAIDRAAIDAALAHVRGSRLERGGLLLGEPLRVDVDDPRIALVHVRAAVPGLDDAATEYSLRLDASVWDAARAALAPGEVVVGWFHSHPDIGAFFSGTDRRTQAGFFHHPFSLGWVVDPVRGEQAWFLGPRSDELPLAGVLPLGTPPET